MAADRMPILPVCFRSWTRVNFAGMPTVDTGRRKVVGRFCSPITTVSHVVRGAMSQVNRRHMRTMLKKVIICVLCFIQLVVRFTQQLKSCYVSLKQALLHCSSLNQTISSQKWHRFETSPSQIKFASFQIWTPARWNASKDHSLTAGRHIMAFDRPLDGFILF